MLEKTLYLTTLFLSANKTALAIQILAAILPALIKGLAVFHGRPTRIVVFAAIQAPIYWILSEATTGEWPFIWYKALKPVISWLGGDIYTGGFSDMLIVYGLPGLAQGLISAALCLFVWRRVAGRLKSGGKGTGKHKS